MNLDSDMPRCAGDNQFPICETCARRLQMQRDEPDRWYPTTPARPTLDGRCIFYIREQSE